MGPDRGLRSTPATPSASAARSAGFGVDAPGAALLLLALLVGLSLIDPAASITEEVSRNYNEGWNAYYALRAMEGRALYPSDEPLLVNNYPPLSFYLVGGLGALIGDNVVAGRIVSLLALLATAVLVGLAANASGAGRRGACLAGLAFTGALCALAPDYVAMNDPQLLAHAVATAGLATLILRPRSAWHLIVAAGLMTVAGLIKHSLVALPLAATLWLALDHRAVLGRWLLVAAGFAALALLGLLALYGPAAVAGLLAPRPFEPARALELTREVLVVLQIPLVVWLILVLVDGRTAATRLVALYGAVALMIGCVLAGGADINRNVFFDLVIALALASGMLFARLNAWLEGDRPVAAARSALVLAMTVGIAVSLPLDPLRKLVPPLAERARESADASAADIAWLRAVDGPAVCATPALCYWAGKRFVLDPFNVEQAILTGGLDPAVLREHVVDRAFSAIQWPADEVFMTGDLQAVLERHYRQARRSPNGVFLVPRGAGAASGR